jgi:hypothetical protein
VPTVLTKEQYCFILNSVSELEKFLKKDDLFSIYPEGVIDQIILGHFVETYNNLTANLERTLGSFIKDDSARKRFLRYYFGRAKKKFNDPNNT